MLCASKTHLKENKEKIRSLYILEWKTQPLSVENTYDKEENDGNVERTQLRENCNLSLVI